MQEKDEKKVNESEEKSKTDDFYVVGIGASAGGLEALEQFFRNADSKSGLSYIVVQHLSPDYKSLMVELLSKYTNMKVLRAEDGMKIEKNKVYLIPPKKNMTVFHRKLFLTDQQHHLGLNLPIDIFFRSLADDLLEKAIGIILSGTGSDGTLGIRAIKGAGGIVMVQDEDSAKFDGMPKSAIATGLVDFVMSPDKMGEQLLRYTSHPLVKKQTNQNQIAKNEDYFSKVLSYIRNNTGTDFTFYKPNTIVRRIERRMSINQVDNIEQYVDILGQSINEIKTLYKELLIGVTKFFRDNEAFKIIKEKVLPKIFKDAQPNSQLRFWVVGCSTGEEAYSLAILIQEYMEEANYNNDVKIFATDIDKEAIEYASAGIYPESIVADVSVERLKAYFSKNGTTFKVKEAIRQMVIFATHNITKDPPFSKIDFISCRNLLIYLEPIMQKRVLSAFSFSLNKGGFMFLGTSESLGDLANSFSTFDLKWKIYNNLRSEKRAILDDYNIPQIKKEVLKTNKETPNVIRGTEEFYENIMDALFDEYVPPSVVIDEKQNVLHVFNDVNKFMQVPKGKMNSNLMNMIPEDLSIPLSTAIHKASKEKRTVKYSNISFKKEDKVFNVNINVKLISNDGLSNKYILIIFEEIQNQDTSLEYTEYKADPENNQRVNDLEQELKYTKENLQATIEELETSNEELQATNEELIASNEELQSTNEELQSVNEELYTVNSEYQQKIEELTELNNDINNWFKTSNISTIFLDLKLRIRKFTPEINKYVNLIQNDIGRPFKHISYNFEYNNFVNDVDKVLKTLNHIEHEINVGKNNWALIKILPYRTTDNAVKGVVITFIDITDRKKQEQQIERERDLLISVLDNSPNAKTMVDSIGNITFANKKAIELFGITYDEMMNMKFNSNQWRVTDKNGNNISDEKRPFMVIKRTKSPVRNMNEYFQTPEGERKKLCISGSPVFDNLNNVVGAVFSIEEEL